MLKKQNTYLKIFILMITILFAISVNALAVSISNVTGLKANISGTNVFLSWNAVQDASGYDIYFNVPGQGYMNLGSVPSNGAKVSGFTPGLSYKAKVRAYKYVNGQKVLSSSDSNEITVKLSTSQSDNKPSKANNLKASITNGQAKLTWDKANNADGYDVYFNIPGQGYTNIGSVDNTTAYVSGFTPGYTYYARILSYKNVNGKKVYADSYSNEVTVKIQETVDYTKPSKPTDLTAYVNNDVVAVDWKNSTNADGYDVYLYTPGTGYKKLTSTTNNYYDIPVNTLKTDKTYRVKVKAYRTVNERTLYSNYSNEASFKIEKVIEKPNMATDLTAYENTKGNCIALDWKQASNVTGYEVHLYTPGTGYKNIASVTHNYYDIPLYSLKKGTTYRVKVRAYTSVGGVRTYADFSNEVKFTVGQSQTTPTPSNTIGDVTGLTVSVKGTEATFNWNKVNGAEGYELRMVIPGVSTAILTSTTNSRVVGGLTTYGQSYTTSVYAYKTVNGKKVYSKNPATVKVYRNNF